jgi:hypothetical protein
LISGNASAKELGKSLIAAVRSGSLDMATKLVAAGAPLEYEDDHVSPFQKLFCSHSVVRLFAGRIGIYSISVGERGR